MAGRKEKIIKGRAEWRRQNRVKTIHIVMTVVAVFLCISIAAGALMVWLQIRKTVARSHSGPSQAPPPVSSVSSGLPVYGNSFSLLLVNSGNPLPAGYHADLEDCGGVSVDARIVPALKSLMQAAQQAGCPLELSGGYADAQKQDELYRAEVARLIKEQKLSQVLAESRAQASVGKAGYSENQTGLAVAFTAAGMKKGEDFSSTAQYRWLVQNSVTFGFVLRFPEGKTSVTGASFNPSRFRYVGTENAMKMREFSMCLEEYASYISQQAG